MKKALVGVSVLAAAVFMVSIANAQFGSVRVPGVGNVTADAKQIEYDSCKSFVDQHRNNIDYNSTNMKGVLDNNKDFSLVKISKDWTRSTNDYDKKNKRWEAMYNYKNFCKMTVRCNKEKCSTMYCNKK